MFFYAEWLRKDGKYAFIWSVANGRTVKMRSLSLKRSFLTFSVARTCATLRRDLSLLALRPSAVLVNGVVKVYNKQVRFLLVDVEALQGRLYDIFTSRSIDLSPAGKHAFSKVTLSPTVYGFDFDIDIEDLASYEQPIIPLLSVDIEPPGRTTDDDNQGRPEDITLPQPRRSSPAQIIDEDDGFGQGSTSDDFVEFVRNGTQVSRQADDEVTKEQVTMTTEDEDAPVENWTPVQSPIPLEELDLEEVSLEDLQEPPKKKAKWPRVPRDRVTRLRGDVIRSWMENPEHTIQTGWMAPDNLRQDQLLDPIDHPISTLGKDFCEELTKSIRESQELAQHRELESSQVSSVEPSSASGSEFMPDTDTEGQDSVPLLKDYELIENEDIIPQQEISRKYETGLESEERLLRELKDKLREKSEIEFSQLCPKTSSRREAASVFYNLLSLASDHSDVIRLQQNEPFGEIMVKRVRDLEQRM